MHWWIFHIWIVDSFGISLDFEISTIRVGIGFIFGRIRVWLGWLILPYKWYNLVRWLERKRPIEENDEEYIEEENYKV